MRKMKTPKPCTTCNINKKRKEFWLLAVSMLNGLLLLPQLLLVHDYYLESVHNVPIL